MQITEGVNRKHSSRAVQQPQTHLTSAGVSRRTFFALLPGLGLGVSTSPVWRQQPQAEQAITSGMVADAEKLIGLSFSQSQRELMLDGVNQNLERFRALRELHLPNQMAPAFRFDPVVPGGETEVDEAQSGLRFARQSLPAVPKDLEELAFLPVTQLSQLVRRRLVSSVELTKMYLGRLRKYDQVLHCVITLCEDLAMKQARRADEELAAGRYRGALHGLPWGAKDVLSVKEYRTTWGAAPYKDQVLHEDATVVTRLEKAGAVLVAKLSMGETARGETWFGGVTRNPWNLSEGASGSSAGPAAATSSGLVAFSIGSDTRGSIVLPCDRCGATGLRPTFGIVSRHGAMVLAWTMDKLGPICRSVEDCVIVLDAIRGPDGIDPTVRAVPFNWNADADIGNLRIGYLKSAFARNYRSKVNDEQALDVLRKLGVGPIAIEMPEFPVQALRLIMDAETGAAFDELILSGQVDLLTNQGKGDRPNNLRHARLIPAVEYIQASRARTILLRRMAEVMRTIDVFVAPSMSDAVLMLTNLTGHPCVVVPNGFANGTPTTISFVGGLFKDAQAALVAHRYQQATDHHLRYPNIKLQR